uniref:Polyamine-modulated factor 1 n=1 Tax=Callorhinchus milii TaxID=7868 RepID=V9LAG0_CALMI
MAAEQPEGGHSLDTASEAAAGSGDPQTAAAAASAVPGDALTEEPSTRRLRVFRAAMEKMLERVVESAGFESFTEAYQPVYELQPEFTRAVHRQIISQMQSSIRDEINQISDEGLLERALPRLDQLEKDSEARAEPGWRPTGDPHRDLRSHLGPYLEQQRNYLRLKVRKAKEENASLAQAVLQGRERITRLDTECKERLGKWLAINEICNQCEQQFNLEAGTSGRGDTSVRTAP